MLRSATRGVLAAAVLSLAACGGDEGSGGAEDGAAVQQQAAGADSQAQPARPSLPPPDLRLEVNVADRELYVYRNDQRIATYPVAVGAAEWPTRTGEWTIGQVVWNPRWTPPQDEEWARDEEVKEPGAPDNPLGRAQLVYDAPRRIHGTNEPESLGKAASHGSIRVSNDVAVRLARMVMESGGAGKDEAWYQRVQANRRERVEVPIPNPIPIAVVSGGSGAGSGSGLDEAPKTDSASRSDDGDGEREKSGSREREKSRSREREKADTATERPKSRS